MDLCESNAVNRQERQFIKAAPILQRGETCWRIAYAGHFDVNATTMAAAIGECRSPLGAVEALRRRAGWSPRFLPLRTVSDAEALLARLRLAGPERPKDLEGRLEHIAERLILRVPPSAWLAALSAALLHCRRRPEAAGRR